ncbi:hypothetical protein JG688_00005665 [Phytophthora aleatoria]|uniref:Uncharacterized protein n=1 Tax=Phytophthora aleatoria TaxID=2496075 RepID=A0A8J5J972_9STRA|nr:hypothetical protein JG688_00005665 [Phytophthora aleatoria]
MSRHADGLDRSSQQGTFESKKECRLEALSSSLFLDRLSIAAVVDGAQRLAVLRFRQAWLAYASVAPLAQKANRRRAFKLWRHACNRTRMQFIRTPTRAFGEAMAHEPPPDT